MDYHDSLQYGEPETSSTYSSEPMQAAEHGRYEHSRPLQTIMTGETLQLEQPGIYQIAQDPFVTPTPSGSMKHYDHGSDYPPTRDISPHTYHAVDTYDSLGPESLPAGAGDVVDHFRHDTEAYASGNYSRGAYHPPRSRSPTPAVDDDDYYIVGDDSVYHSGYTNPVDYSQTYDFEKEPNSDYGHYPTEQYATSRIPYYDGEKTPSLHSSELPETPLETRHFGPAPTGRVLRRHKTRKRVQLTNGNLVVDIDVPPKLILPRREPEMMRTRYTAVTCDPDDFEKKGFFLRQNESGRRTELFIVITMFNVCQSLRI